MKTKPHEHHYETVVDVGRTTIPLAIFFAAAIFLTAAVASCKTPTEITARPDPTAATSGTVGSSKATDGIIPLQPTKPPDSTRKL
jgi:hypothetical protein